MNDNNYVGVINGWQALIIMLPSVLAFLTSCWASYLGYKNKEKIDKKILPVVAETKEKIDINTAITAETKEKIEIAVNNNIITPEILDANRKDLLNKVMQSIYAEGILEGLKKEVEFTKKHFIEELRRNNIMNVDNEEIIFKIIEDNMKIKEQLIEDALESKRHDFS